MFTAIQQRVVKLEQWLDAEAWPEAAHEMQQVQQLIFQLQPGAVAAADLQQLEKKLAALMAFSQMRRNEVGALLKVLAPASQAGPDTASP